MFTIKDLTGQRFGKLTVVKLAGKNEKGKVIWHCKCDCGNEVIKRAVILQQGAYSCGCKKKRFKDLTGQTFGYLTVLKENTPNNTGPTKWDCQCVCGKIKNLHARRLLNETVSSCGCKHYKYGEENPKWNHNLSREERAERRDYLPETIEWRNSVYKRDNYKCQLSGMNKDFNAHHINAWRDYKELRWDINNGVTIWEPLHILFHRLYGKGNNTKAQWDEFTQRYKNKEFDKSYYPTEMIQEMEQRPVVLELNEPECQS